MRHHDGEQGAVAVVFAVFTFAVLFVLAALIVDLGLARDTRSEAQNAADAAALAGANALSDSTVALISAAREEIGRYANTNYGTENDDWEDCQDENPLTYVPLPADISLEPPYTTCISFNSEDDPTQVRVAIPVRHVPSFFGNAFGYTGLDISAVAVAEVAPTGGFGSPCAFCALGDDTPDFQHTQDFELRVNGGDVHFNGNHDGTGTVVVDPLRQITVEGDADATYNPVALPGGHIEDPLAALDFPDISGLPDQSATAACPVLEPGIYGNLPVSSGCTLAPGLYVVTGSLNLVGGPGTTVTATGVTLLFACGTPDNVRACNDGELGGGVSIGGLARLELTAPTSGPTAGLALLYDRQKRQDIQLNRASTVTGTIYGASATLDVRGDGCSTQPHQSLVVVQTVATDIEDDESPCFTMEYEEDVNVFEGEHPALIRPASAG